MLLITFIMIVLDVFLHMNELEVVGVHSPGAGEQATAQAKDSCSAAYPVSTK